METELITKALASLAQNVTITWPTTNAGSPITSAPSEPTKAQRPIRPILDRFPDDAFRKLVFGFDESHHALVRVVAKEAESFLKRACLNKRTLATWQAFVGPSGTGKSTIAKACFSFFERHAVDLWYEGIWSCGGKTPSAALVDISQLMDMDDADWDRERRELLKSQFLIFDDLGADANRYRSGTAAARLRSLLESAEAKWVLITTNTLPERWPQQFDARVASRLSASRIVQTSGIPDYRPKLAAKAKGTT